MAKNRGRRVVFWLGVGVLIAGVLSGVFLREQVAHEWTLLRFRFGDDDTRTSLIDYVANSDSRRLIPLLVDYAAEEASRGRLIGRQLHLGFEENSILYATNSIAFHRLYRHGEHARPAICGALGKTPSSDELKNVLSTGNSQAATLLGLLALMEEPGLTYMNETAAEFRSWADQQVISF